MRVLTVGNMYPPHHQGGYELVWRDVVDGLRCRGDEVVVLTTDHREPGVSDPDEPFVHRELRWYWHDHRFPPVGARERREIERHNARVFDAHADGVDLVMWWSMGGMSLSLIARARARAMAIVHDAWLVYGPQVDANIARRRRAFGRRRFDPRAIDWLSFNSSYTQDQAVRAGVALDLERCSVEHPGIDPARFPPTPPGEWAWRLAAVGRVDPRKGLATAITALGALPEQARLTIAGGGDEAHRAELEAFAAQRGLADRVALCGPVDDAAAVYASADAVVFPVEWAEPWGLVPLEAMSVGRPVVATGTGGSAEYLRHEENCLRFEPGDADALAAAVRRLADDRELRERVRGGGAATARLHTQNAFVDAICARAEMVVGGRRAAG